ncbi:ankyrin repeat-containing domain protein [Cladorrhinum sp. PSN259]|nr:ankyrin repeat-containing domain protein [Cladorrhinum sp. PSN259]
MSGLEVIGVAASIGALVEIADRAYKVVFKYFPAVKNARKDVQRLIIEIRSLCGVLHSLKIFAASLEDETLAAADMKAFRMQHVESCYHTLSKIRSDLQDFEAGFNSKNKLKGLHRSLRWPFCEEETIKLLDRVNADKQTMNLAMTVDSTSALLRTLSRYHEDTSRQMAEIQSDVRRTLEFTRRVDINSKRRQVLECFHQSEAQASELLETSVVSRFPFTGLWLTQGEQFREWLSTARSRLWLAGIPGAGKTVLAGAMIEEALGLCNPECAVAFFFCDASKGPVTSLEGLLGTLAAQLARQKDDAFEILEQYHAELNPEQGITRAASASRLSRVLAGMINSFGRVYIIVDGLDEYGDEALEIIKTLIDIWTSTDTCSIALLSRDEAHIREQLEDKFQYIQGTAHKDDIEPYVITKIQERFGESKKKRKMADKTKEAITKALVEGAAGMFRWVVCQLDYICEFSTDKDRLDALNNLPPDLAKTYQRILDRVNEKGQHIQTLVQQVLCLVDFREEPITIPELREAISTHISHPDDIIPEDEIALRCSSLIRKSNDGVRFEFAHFTVREFLRSHELQGTIYDKYHISDAKVSVVLASVSIKFLLQPDFSTEHRDYDLGARHAIERVKAHPFYSYAAKFWTSALDKSWWDDDTVRRLLIQLFSQPKTGNCTNWAIEFCRHLGIPGCQWFRAPRSPPTYDNNVMAVFRDVVTTITRADFTPLHIAALLAIPWLTNQLLKHDTSINPSSQVGTPLHCAVIGTYIFASSELTFPALSCDPVKELLEKLHIVGETARISTIKVLLEAGANPSEVCHSRMWSHTPLCVSLQAARGSLNFDVFLELLKAGALIDNKTYQVALEMFRSNQELDPSLDTHTAEKIEARITSAVEGILQFAIDRRPLRDKSAALRTATLQFITDSNINFRWASSTMRPAYKSMLGSDTCHHALEDVKLAIKFGDMKAARKMIQNINRNILNDRLSGGGTLLHYSVGNMAVEAIRILVDSGIDANITDNAGNIALMMCCRDRHVPILRALLACGARTHFANARGVTLWHRAAATNAVDILEVLIHESQEDKITALSRHDEGGFTPFSIALYSGAVKSAMLLLSHCQGEPSCVAMPRNGPLYRRVTASTRSLELLQAIRKAGIPLDPVLDDGDTPLHYLRLDHGPQFVSFLKALYPNAGRRAIDKMTPLGLLLPDVYVHKRPDYLTRGWETIKELASEHLHRNKFARGTRNAQKEPEETNPQFLELKELFSNLQPFQPRLPCLPKQHLCAVCTSQVNLTCEFLLDIGAFEAFEAETCSSGVIPLILRLQSDLMFNRNLLTAAQGPLRRAFHSTKHMELAIRDPVVLILLRDAVYFDISWLLDLLLENGVDVHTRGDDKTVSALELACIPGPRCSPRTLEKLLAKADPARIDELKNKDGFQQGLIHILASPVQNDPYPCEKLEILIHKGLRVDARTGNGVPPMVFHLEQRSFETAKILLKAGADPNLQDSDGWDSILTAVKVNDPGFLQEVERLATAKPGSVDWQKQCTVQKKLGTLQIMYVGCNALHVAALYPAGELECLRFVLQGAFVDNMSPLTQDGFSYLHLAARWGHTEALRLLGSHKTAGTFINYRATGGLIPLDDAVSWGSVEVVKTLLDLGADSTILGFNDHTPAVTALIQGEFEIAKILDSSQTYKLQDEKVAKNERINGMRQALENAIINSRIESCKKLFKMGCPLNKPLLRCGACSPLLLALREDQCAIVAWMVETGVDLNILAPVCEKEYYSSYNAPALATRSVDPVQTLSSVMTAYLKAGGLLFLDARTPFHAAAAGKTSTAIPVIVKHIKENVNLYRATHSSILDGCVTADDVVRALVNVKAFFPNACGRTALHLAVEWSSVQSVVELLKIQADPNQPEDQGDTPLHLAAQNGSDTDTMQKIVKELMNAGARLEHRNLFLLTPLLEALAQAADFKVIQMLLEHGANPHALDEDGMSALALSRDPVTFRHLLKLGLDPLQLDCFGQCPATRALSRPATRPMVMNELDIRDIPPLKVSSSSLMASAVFLGLLHYIRLINKRQNHIGRPSLVDLHTKEGLSPLCFAARYGDVEATRTLLRAGSQIDTEDSAGATALTTACSNGRLEVVKLLMERGASILYMDKTNTPQSALAAAYGFPNIMHWLVVEQFTYRKRLADTAVTSDHAEDQPLSLWSGPWAARIPLSMAEREWSGRDFGDFSHRNTKLRRKFAGMIVSGIRLIGPSDETEETG